MKKQKNINLISISTMIIVGVLILVMANQFMIFKFESKIESNMQNYKFSDSSKLKGLQTTFKEVNCSGVFTYQCHITDFTVNMIKDNKKGQTGLIPFFISKNTVIDTIDYFKPFSFNITMEKLDLADSIKNNLFFGYSEKEYRDIGEKLYNNIFPAYIKVKIDMNKINKDAATGEFKIHLENKLSKININTDLYINANPYVEKVELIETNEKSKVEGETSELHANVPVFTKIDNFVYNIENKNGLNFLYTFYKLNGINIEKEDKNKIRDYNFYYLESISYDVLSKEEFTKLFLKMLDKYYNKIPEDEKSFKKFVFYVKQMANNEIKGFNVSGKNINNVSMERTGILIFLDNLNTTKRYLDESFEFKFTEIK